MWTRSTKSNTERDSLLKNFKLCLYVTKLSQRACDNSREMLHSFSIECCTNCWRSAVVISLAVKTCLYTKFVHQSIPCLTDEIHTFIPARFHLRWSVKNCRMFTFLSSHFSSWQPHGNVLTFRYSRAVKLKFLIVVCVYLHIPSHGITGIYITV